MSEPLGTRARRLVDLKRKAKQAKQAAEKADREYRDAEQDFWLTMEDDEATTSTVLNEEEAAAALKEMGYDDAALGPPKIRKRVLNEIVRNLMQAKQDLPAGVDFYTKRYITVSEKGA